LAVTSRFVDRWVTRGDRISAWGDRLLRTRGIRRTWLIGAGGFGALLLAWSTLQVMEVLAHEQRTEDEVVPAAGLDALVVDNVAGSVTVVGVDDADAVSVHARISDGFRRSGHAVTERDGRLSVEGSCPLFLGTWCEVDYTIEVPSGLPVEIDSEQSITVTDVDAGVVVNSDEGEIELSRIGGDIDVSADQGRIEATDLAAGRVTASADQGRVTLEFAESPRRVDVSADQGRVEIVVPDEADVFYAVETSADQGSVTNSIGTDPDSDRSIRVDADQGDITLTYGS
jgi:Putative adhesin